MNKYFEVYDNNLCEQVYYVELGYEDLESIYSTMKIELFDYYVSDHGYGNIPLSNLTFRIVEVIDPNDLVLDNKEWV